MIANRAFARLGAALCVLSLLSGCASFPAMSVSTANGGSAGTRGEASRSGAIPRPQAQVAQIPRLQTGGPGRAQAPEATAAQIAEIVPDEPIGATVPPQAVPQFLNTVFADVLRVPYSLGPNVALRTDVLSLNAPATLSKRAYVSVLGTALRAYGLVLSAQGRGFAITEEGGPGGALPTVVRSRSSADTPLGARSVTQYFQLVALQADAVQGLVQSMIGGRAAISVDSAANALILTGTGRNVAQAVDILRNLDQPAFAGAQVVRMEPVFWSADTFATALQNALAAEGYVVSTDPLGPKSILILPLTTTNQTLAFAADTATMDRVRYWARELDQPSALGDQNTTFVYEVRNTSAAAIGQMLISAGGTQARITGIGPGGAAAVVQALGGPAGVQALQGGRGGGGGGQNRGGIQAQQLQGGRGGGGGAGGANQGLGQNNRGGVGINNLQNPTGAAAPFGGAVPGGGAITVDDAGNRILFTGTATQFAQLRNLLQQLDAPARQVRVEVTVAEVTLTDETRAGLEFFFDRTSRNGGVWRGGTQTSTGASGLALGTNGVNVTWNGGDIRAAFNAFASNNKVNILSRPSLTARSGSPGAIQVGADVPFIQQQRAANTTTTTALDVIQTVSYRQTGVILQITPVVYGDDRVDLTIYQEVSADRDNPNTAITSPIFDTRSVQTTLSLADGETAVLGGLIEDSFSKVNRGIPFLKDVPILGQAFRADEINGRKTELVVLLTPFIIHDSEEMLSVSNQMSNEINHAFKVGKGGSYTLTPWSSGVSLGLNPPDPKVRQGYARPEPSAVATPGSPANAQPATVPAAPSSPGPGPGPEPAAPPPSAPASSPPARR